MAKKSQDAIRVSSPPVGPPQEPPAPRREQVKAQDYFSVYVNDVQVQTSTWDLRMLLGEMSPVEGEANAMHVELLGELRMSPQLAKNLTHILIQQLKTYEEHFGEIPGSKAT